MKRLKVSHKGTHKIAHLQKGARHSFARTKRTRKKAPACLKQIAATPALPLQDTSTPRTFISAPAASALPHPSGTAKRRRRVRQQRTHPNSRPADDAPPTAGAAIPRKRGRGASAGASPRAGESGRRWKRNTKSRSPRVSARALLKEGGDLLSRIAVQYHRRARA